VVEGKHTHSFHTRSLFHIRCLLECLCRIHQQCSMFCQCSLLPLLQAAPDPRLIRHVTLLVSHPRTMPSQHLTRPPRISRYSILAVLTI
jgi:hypothetical protein